MRHARKARSEVRSSGFKVPKTSNFGPRTLASRLSRKSRALVRCVRWFTPIRPIMDFTRKVRTRLAVDIGGHIVRIVIRQTPTPGTRHIRFDEGCRHTHPRHTRSDGVGLRAPDRRRRHCPQTVRAVAESTFARKHVLPVAWIERAP